MILLECLVLWIAPAAFAAPPDHYWERLARTKTREHELSRKLGLLGAKVGFTPESETGESKEPPARLIQVHDQVRSVFISGGKFVFGRLVNRLVVGGDGSPVIIEVGENQGGLSGLRFMGTARQAGTEGRVSLEIGRIILRSGKGVALAAVGLDSVGAYGLEAEVISGKFIAVAGSIASSFVSGLAAAQQTQTTTAFGFQQVKPTGRNAILQGVAQSAGDQSKRLIEEATEEKPILIVEAGTDVTVLIQEEVRW